MKPFNEKQKQSWAKSQKLGKLKYTIYIGLTWAILTASVIPFISYLFSGFSEAGLERLIIRFTTTETIIRYSIFVIVGLWYGSYMWQTNQKRYNKTIELQANNI